MYRFLNIFNSLSEIKTKLTDSIIAEENIECHFEIENDMLDTVELLDNIKNYIETTRK